jgi:hypothetical protein
MAEHFGLCRWDEVVMDGYPAAPAALATLSWIADSQGVA